MLDEQIRTDALQFEIKYSMRELYAAFLWIWLRKPLVWILWACVVYSAGAYVGGPLGLLLATAFFLAVPYSRTRTSMKRFNIGAGISCGFSPEGFSIKTNQVAITYAWSVAKKVRESRKFIVMFLSGGFHVIPLRQITRDQAEQLRAILQTHVAKNVKLARG